MHNLASKLNRVNSVLSKLRHFVSSEILRSVYFAIFQSHVNCVSTAWGLTRYPQHKKIFSNILKFVDITSAECCIFVNNCFNMDSFSVFTENFKLASATHSYIRSAKHSYIRSARSSLLFIPSYNTIRFGRKSVIHSTTLAWNLIQDKLT